jgi:hypothetical protein
MIYGVKVILKYALGLDQAGRNFAVLPDDCMLVSYPRSGNTWTRFLIANLAHPDKTITFANIERLIPDTSSISSRGLKNIPRPRIIKTHEYFDHRYPKVIYIVRDPRDVVLSYYDFQRKYRHIPDGYPLERYVEDFVKGNLISADWGTWGENVASWLSTRGRNDNFILLRYEDMLQNTRRELARVAEFLGLATSDATIQRAISASSAGRMRQLEQQDEDKWVATKKHRKDIPFVRVAKAGGWTKNLPSSCAAQIEATWRELMSSLNYVPVSDQVAQDEVTAGPPVS